MARKSKGNFNLKGHSIPGIKGFKGTTLEDGRSASSAFQMQSPLYVETNSDVTLDTSDPTKDLDLSGGMDKSLTKSNKESSAQYLFRQKMLFNQRKEDREKEKAKSSVEKIDDQTTAYDGDEGTYEEYRAEMGGGEGTLSMAEWSELNSQNVDQDIGKGNVDTNIETYVDPNASTEEVVEAGNEVIPNVELKSSPGDPYSYRGTEDGGYEYKKEGSEWTTATGKGLESIKKRYEK